MRRLGHRPELDGVRGIAILLVVAMHVGYAQKVGWTEGGLLGVDLFFVLSGFLITSLLLGERAAHGTISLKAFYGRRARRLLPALLAIVGLFAFVAVESDPSSAPHVLGESAIRVSYLANFFRAFGPGLGLFGHLWSLAEEEQFYLLWPVLLIVLLRRGRGPRPLLLVLGGAIVAVNLERIVLIAQGASASRLWYAPDTHADPLLFGSAAAVLWSYGLVRIKGKNTVAAALVAILLVARFRGSEVIFYPIVLPIFALVSAIVIVGLLDGSPRSRLARTMRFAPLRGAGKVSYGLYLWHAPLITAFGLRGLLPAIIATLLSYRYIERPFLRRSGARAKPDRHLKVEPAGA